MATVERWRAAAPPGFQFTLKAWQVITHPPTSATYRRTRLDDHDRQACGNFGYNATIRWAWDQTYAVATALRAGLVLFQSPASFTPTKENLARFRQFFEHAKRGRLPLGWEPRGAWEPATISALCRELDLVHVTDPFHALPAATRPLQYFRLHGVTGARHRYSAAELRQLRDWCARSRTTYCVFNHQARAPDARRFAATVRGDSIS